MVDQLVEALSAVARSRASEWAMSQPLRKTQTIVAKTRKAMARQAPKAIALWGV